MFAVLEISLGHHMITRCLSIACQRQVLVHHLLGITAHANAWSIAIIDLVTVRLVIIVAAIVAAALTTIVVTLAHLAHSSLS